MTQKELKEMYMNIIKTEVWEDEYMQNFAKKNCASVLKVSSNDNLLFSLQIPGITTANICGTKKEVEKVVDFWNKCHKKNGTFGGL